MKTIVIPITFVIALSSSLAYGDDKYMTPLNKGIPAPYNGVLLSPPAIASIIADKESEKERINLEVDTAVKKVTAKFGLDLAELTTKNDSDKKILQAQVDAGLAENKEKDKIIDKNQQTIKPITWLCIGGVAGTAITIGLVVLVNSVKL
jgi:hypothetical protein